MHFVRLTLQNFGPFRHFTVEFPPSGVLVISGPNGSGKTQLIGAAIAAVVGKRVVALGSAEADSASVSLTLSDGTTEEVASLVVSAAVPNKGKGPRQCNFKHHTTSISQQLLSTLQQSSGPSLILADRRARALTVHEIAEFERVAPAEIHRSEFWRHMRESRWLVSDAYSASVGIVIKVLREFMARVAASPLPLLVDGVVGELDQRAAQFCRQLLCEIGRSSQVILVTPSFDPALGRDLIRLPRLDPRLPSIAHYDGRNALPLRRPATRLRAPTRTFTLGAQFPVQENRQFEFKEVKGQNPAGSIGQVADQYVVAFLNAGVKQTGSIFWGVTNARKVVGVPLTDQQCDEIRRVVVERVGNIKPPLALSSLIVELHPIQSDSPVPLYVVEVKVPSAHGTYLYATGSEEVYIRTDAGKKKLNIMQIQQELLRRAGVEPPKA